MIINIKSFMATVMAAILVLAVVIPIAGSMIDLSAEKVYSDNTLQEGEYLMTEMQGTRNPRLAVIDDADGVQLSISQHREPVTSRTVIFTDTIVVEFTANQFKVYYNEAGTSGYYSSQNGDYIAIQHGIWHLYKYTEDADPNAKTTDDMKQEDIVRAFQDAEQRASLLERIPAANLAQFSVKELEDMAKEGVDVLRAVSQYKAGHYGWIVYPDSQEGDLFYAIGNRGTAYVDSDATIYTAGASVGTDGRAVLKGTLNDMDVVHSYFEIDPTNIQCNYEPSGFTNVLTSITYSDGTDHEPYTVNHFIIPLKYTSDKEVGMAGTLVGLVPVVLIVGLIVGIVSVHLIRRGEDF